MMRRYLISFLMAVVLAGSSSSAQAGARIETGEKSYLDIGLRLQPIILMTEEDLDKDGTYEDSTDAKIRRGRLRFRFQWNEHLGAFVQTGIGRDDDTAGLGEDMRLFDAYVHWKHTPELQLYFGQHLVPSTRQAMSSSGGHMAGDYPSITYKALTWGSRAFIRFANSTYTDSDSGLRPDAFIRDQGATLFGSHSFSDEVHGKYYLGAYEGVREATTQNPHLVGRVQVNLFDAEPNYFHKATYLGTLRTIGFGAAYNSQNSIIEDTEGEEVDYSLLTGDVFLEWPLGPGAVTWETALIDLDLGGATSVDHDGLEQTAPKDYHRVQGNGYYTQAGYYWNRWQPWVMYENWNSDADDGKGSFNAYRTGLSYFFMGHQANIKLGYEHFEADAPIGSSEETTIHTVMLGLYLNY